MPPAVDVLSHEADEAVRLIRRQQAVLQRRLLGRGLGRQAVGRLHGMSGADLADVGSRASIPLHVSVAEEFQRRRLIDYSARQIPSPNRMLGALWRQAQRDRELSWDKQVDAWKEWHGIQLKQQPWWASFTGFIETRNALVHGLGGLTPRQIRNRQEVLTALKAAGVSVEFDGRLMLTEHHVRSCAELACGLITWLDEVTR